jgi:hypothetical protein
MMAIRIGDVGHEGSARAGAKPHLQPSSAAWTSRRSASPPISLFLIALRSRESERGAQVAHEVDAVLGFLTLSDRVGEQLTGQLTAGGLFKKGPTVELSRAVVEDAQ